MSKHKQQELNQYRTRMVQSRDFSPYARVIFSTLLEYKPEITLPDGTTEKNERIVSTDGVTIFVNDDFFLLSDEKKDYMHFLELMHCALLHPQKANRDIKQGYDAWLLNMTQNCTLNEMLKENDALKKVDCTIEEFVLWDYNLLYKEGVLNPDDISPSELGTMSAKQLHNYLATSGNQDALASLFSKMPVGDIIPNLTDSSQEALDEGLVMNQPEDIAAEAFQQMFKDAAKKAGSGQPFLDKLLREFPKPKQDWKKVLRVEVSALKSEQQEYSERLYDPDAYTLSSDPNFVPLIPDLDFDDKNEDLGVALDLSGSVFYQNGLVAKFISELNSLQKTFNCNIKFITFDDGIVDEYDYDSDDEEFANKIKKGEYRVAGAGGTNFIPVLNRFKELPNINKVVMLTDLEGPSGNPHDYRSLKVLWVIPDPDTTSYRQIDKAPFGQLLYIK